MWRFLLPKLTLHYQVVLFDYVGSGNSLLTDYSPHKYSTLAGYTQDIIDIIDALALKDVTVIGHSVSASIAALAAVEIPDLIKKIVMVCPSPCFLNIPPDYEGGFEKSDLEELISLMDKNYIGWANYLAPLVMGTANSPELISELSGSFCSTDPVIAKTFAKATFFSDHRHILPNILCPVQILQSSSDALASKHVGEYINKAIPHSEMVVVEAQGHCIHMSHYEDILPAMLLFIDS